MIAAIAVIGVVVWSSQKKAETSQNNSNTNTSKTTTTVNVNTVTGENPAQQQVETGVVTLQSAQTKTIGEIVTYNFGDGNILNVLPLSMKAGILNETGVKNTTDVTVAGKPGQKLQLTSAKDGSLFNIIEVTIDDKLYDFRGSADFLNNLDQYVSFSK